MQGSCLAPALFAICLDDALRACLATGLGFVIAYADDVLLITRSISGLQFLRIVEHELLLVDLHINVKKSSLIRVGPRFDVDCNGIFSLDGHVISCVKEVRYLGVVILSGARFSCSFWSGQEEVQ
jgi:hypothetical protein